jgi:ADP-ribosyl-[dinitrogen reductase] hydrolase
VLLEIAIGDAYGAGFEYADSKVVRTRNTLSGYVQHKRHTDIKPGRYTDDTQMSLAIAEAMLSDLKWGREFLADKFVESFKRDPRTGYAGRFYDFLKSVEDGADFLARIEPHSDKSGAAMRAPPLGLYADVNEVVKRCRVQAALTHDTEDGTNAAVAAALLAHYCAYDLGAVARAGEFIEGYVPGPWATPWVGKVGSKGWMSVRAAVTAVSRARRLSAMLQECIAFEGDVDTVASIAMGAASMSREIERDIPPVLVAQLEDGPYGRTYIEELDEKLLVKSGFRAA